MEILFEFIFELLFEGSVEVAKSRKTPRWIRYPVIALLSLCFIAVVLLFFVLGIFLIIKNESYSLFLGLVFLIIDVLFVVSIIKKIKEFRNRK